MNNEASATHCIITVCYSQLLLKKKKKKHQMLYITMINGVVCRFVQHLSRYIKETVSNVIEIGHCIQSNHTDNS